MVEPSVVVARGSDAVLLLLALGEFEDCGGLTSESWSFAVGTGAADAESTSLGLQVTLMWARRRL